MTAAAGERQRFGRYETLFRIAGGGMAEVYAARALGEGGFQKLVALKRMRPELAEDTRFVTMFLDEGRVAANIASPNVVSTLDLGRAEDDSLYLVMELVTGAPLSALMAGALARAERIPVPLAVDVLAQAASGLHAAHEARSPTGEPLEIVHRDCSPHNILVDVHGQVKITDFGIAKALERQTRSQAGEMKGKLQYLSPEQARGRPVDRRADIFILGVVAWEVFAGRRLFAADNPVQALHEVATKPIPRLDELPGGPGPDVAAAVAQALERDPDHRFATAEAFGNALRNAVDARRPPASEVGALVRRYGGESLRAVEGRIREALGAGPESAPPPRSAEHPIPLTARRAPVDDARSRAATVPSTPPPPGGPPASAARGRAPEAAPAFPKPAPLPSGVGTPASTPPAASSASASGPPGPASAPPAASSSRPPGPASAPPAASSASASGPPGPASSPPAASSSRPPGPASAPPSAPGSSAPPVASAAPSRPRIATAPLSTEGTPSSAPPPAGSSRPRLKTVPWTGEEGATASPGSKSAPPAPRGAKGWKAKLALFLLLAILGGGGGALAAWWSSQREPPGDEASAAAPTGASNADGEEGADRAPGAAAAGSAERGRADGVQPASAAAPGAPAERPAEGEAPERGAEDPSPERAAGGADAADEASDEARDEASGRPHDEASDEASDRPRDEASDRASDRARDEASGRPRDEASAPASDPASDPSASGPARSAPRAGTGRSPRPGARPRPTPRPRPATTDDPASRPTDAPAEPPRGDRESAFSEIPWDER